MLSVLPLQSGSLYSAEKIYIALATVYTGFQVYEIWVGLPEQN